MKPPAWLVVGALIGGMIGGMLFQVALGTDYCQLLCGCTQEAIEEALDVWHDDETGTTYWWDGEDYVPIWTVEDFPDAKGL